MLRRRVVVTGIGVVSSAGIGTDVFWRGLTAGATGFSRSSPELACVGANVIAAVHHYSGMAYLQNERNGRILNRTFELLVGAGALAAADAALAAAPVAPHRLGVIVGIGPIDQYTDDLLEAVRQAKTEAGVDLMRFAESYRAMYPSGGSVCFRISARRCCRSSTRRWARASRS